VPDQGRRFWMVMTPLVGLIALANLIVAWRSRDAQRRWWMLGVGTTLAVVIVTFTYFVPALMRFQQAGDLPPGALDADIQRWVQLNWVRAVVYTAGWLAALKAFSSRLRAFSSSASSDARARSSV